MFRGFSAANAAAPALATDALKATDTFSPNIITIMPTSRINVAACSGPSRLRWELLNVVDAEKRRLLRLAAIHSFIYLFGRAILRMNKGCKLVPLATHRGD